MGGEKGTAELSKQYGRISLGVLLVKSDGTLIDRYYTNFGVSNQLPTPAQIIAALDRSLKGEGTLPVLSALVEKNPQDAVAAFKLARKYEEIMDAKSADLYRKVVGLDPEEKAGTIELPEGKVSYKEYAEFKVVQHDFASAPRIQPVTSSGGSAASTAQRGSAPAAQAQQRPSPNFDVYWAFIGKHPQSVLLQQAYRTMASYFTYSGTKAEAADFFAALFSKYPNEAWAFDYYLMRILRDKDPAEADKGIALAYKLEKIQGRRDAGDSQTLANLYLLKGDQEKAEGAFGKEWLESSRNEWAQSLLGYATFWRRNKNSLEGAEEIVDQAVLLGPASWRFRQQAAGLYLQLDKPEKALKVYGPEMTRTTSGTVDEYLSYVSFWTKQGKGRNVDGVLAVAKQIEAVSLSSAQWYSLAQAYFDLTQHGESTGAPAKATSKALKAQAAFDTARSGDAQRAIQKALEKETNQRAKATYTTLQQKIEEGMKAKQGAAGK